MQHVDNHADSNSTHVTGQMGTEGTQVTFTNSNISNRDDDCGPNEEKEDAKPPRPPFWQVKLSALYAAFFVLGFTGGIVGPSMVDLQEWFGVDTQTFSFSFTVGGLGYLSGTVLCGFVYEFFNYEIQFAIFCLVHATATAFCAWNTKFVSFLVIGGIGAVTGGLIDTCGQAYILYVTSGHRYHEPMMQAAHAMWSLGVTIIPMMVQPFLTKNSTRHNDDVLNATGTEAINTTSFLASSSEDDMLQSTVPSLVMDTETSIGVKHAFLLIGSCFLIPFTMFLVMWMLGPKYCLTHKHKKRDKNKNPKEKLRRRFYIGCLMILGTFYFFQCGVEMSLGNFIALFAIRGLGWSKTMGAWVTTVMWAGQLSGRLLSVPVAVFLKPRTMVYMSVGGTTFATLLLLLVGVFDALFWVGVALAGLALSSTFGSMVLWAATHIPVTGISASVFLVGASAGGMLGPLLIGQLFERYQPMCFIYVIVAGAALQLMTLITFELFVRKCRKSTNRAAQENVSRGAEMITLNKES